MGTCTAEHAFLARMATEEKMNIKYMKTEVHDGNKREFHDKKYLVHQAKPLNEHIRTELTRFDSLQKINKLHCK